MSSTSNSTNPCAAAGFDYDCSTPTPRSSFASALNESSGPLCESVAQFLYDPSNCDEGYWCGCTTVIPQDCLPSNSNNSNWMGHYTTVNKTSGETIVLQGLVLQINDAIENPFNLSCRDGFYCPGRTKPQVCVDLCPPKFSCANSGVAVECAKGGYCPIATTTPKKCEGLQRCNQDGLRRFQNGAAMVVIALVIVVVVGHLFICRHIVIKNARHAKAVKMAAKKENIKKEEEPLLENKVETDNGEVLPKDADDTQKVIRQDGSGDDPKKEKEQAAAMVDIEAGDSTKDPTMDKEEKQETAMDNNNKTSDDSKHLNIKFKDLSLTIPNVGTIMHGVSGSLEPGQLTAIMGPSGAGKTTFLNIMAGKVDRTGGSLTVNGKETELTRYRRIIGFVPQEDIMLRNLTVEDNIRHSALMRLPKSWEKSKKLQLVNEAIDSLEIDVVRDSIVGDEHRRGISGGQRKRVNIALETVTQPDLLCLDEPTSGLDSTTSLTVVKSLKDLATSGVNVVAVLHQPKYEIFLLFDKVLLLGQGGRTVYYGPAANMTDYFDQRGFPLPSMANPADFYLDVLSGLVPHASDPDFVKEDLLEAWMCAPENPDAVSPEEAKAGHEASMARDKAQEEEERTKQNKKTMFHRMADVCVNMRTGVVDICKHLFREVGKDASGRKTPGVFGQFVLLFKRSYLQRVRNPWNTVLTVILMIIAGLVVPSIVPDDAILYNGIPKSLEEGDDPFWQAYLDENIRPVDRVPGVLMSVYFFLLIISCLSVSVFGGERPVFFRETASGQVVFSYWAAKTLETLLWVPLYAAAFVLVGYNSEAWFLQPLSNYWTFFFLDIVGFYGFGMLASLLIRNSAALLSLVFGILIIIFFGGTTGEANSVSYAFFVYWSTQGLSTNEYKEYSYAFNVTQLNANTDTSGTDELGTGTQSVGQGVGSGFDLDSGFARNAAICFVTAFAWHIIVLWTLKTRNHKMQR